MTRFRNILDILNKLNINFDIIEHEKTTSCEHSKILRNEKWLKWIWSKNIIFHAKWNFYLVTTIRDKDIKAKKFKTEFKTKDIRFATQEEITKIWLWTIWSIAPFWFENKNIPIFVDEKIFENDFFIFNPADPCKSIRISTKDLKEIYMKNNYNITFFKITEENIEFKKQ